MLTARDIVLLILKCNYLYLYISYWRFTPWLLRFAQLEHKTCAAPMAAPRERNERD